MPVCTCLMSEKEQKNNLLNRAILINKLKKKTIIPSIFTFEEGEHMNSKKKKSKLLY